MACDWVRLPTTDQPTAAATPMQATLRIMEPKRRFRAGFPP